MPQLGKKQLMGQVGNLTAGGSMGERAETPKADKGTGRRGAQCNKKFLIIQTVPKWNRLFCVMITSPAWGEFRV